MGDSRPESEAIAWGVQRHVRRLILEAVPRPKSEAVTVGALAMRLDIAHHRIRSVLRQLEGAREVSSTNGAGVIRYHRNDKEDNTMTDTTARPLKDRVLEELETTGDSLTALELGGRLHARPNNVTTALAELKAEGLTGRDGEGKRGDPFRHFRRQDPQLEDGTPITTADAEAIAEVEETADWILESRAELVHRVRVTCPTCQKDVEIEGGKMSACPGCGFSPLVPDIDGRPLEDGATDHLLLHPARPDGWTVEAWEAHEKTRLEAAALKTEAAELADMIDEGKDVTTEGLVEPLAKEILRRDLPEAWAKDGAGELETPAPRGESPLQAVVDMVRDHDRKEPVVDALFPEVAASVAYTVAAKDLRRRADEARTEAELLAAGALLLERLAEQSLEEALAPEEAAR